MACAAVAGRQLGGGCSLWWTSVGSRVAFIHGSPPCNEKWDKKWKSVVHGYMDADACRKRYRDYIKRQKRAADKRALLKWRSLEMHADDYWEVQEKRRQKVESSAKKTHKGTTSGWSCRLEEEWKKIQKKSRAWQWENSQAKANNRDTSYSEDPTFRAAEEPNNTAYQESESARYRRKFWSNSWRASQGFAGSGANWNFGGSSSGGRPHQGEAHTGSSSDRLALGLSPSGPLSLEELKIAIVYSVEKSGSRVGLVGSTTPSSQNPHYDGVVESTNSEKNDGFPVALQASQGYNFLLHFDLLVGSNRFRQCALSWHPDRHHGGQKQLAEAKFKRVGDAYRTLRELL